MDISEPISGKENIKVKILVCGICGTDIHLLHDSYPFRPSVITDRKFSDAVTEVGEDVRTFSPCDRVVTLTATDICEAGENKSYPLGQNVGTLVLTEDENVVIMGLEDGLYALDLTTGSLTLKVDLEQNCSSNRLNVGKVDAAGRIWIGSPSASDHGAASERSRQEIEGPCSLYRVNTDYTYNTQIENVKLSNGMA